MRAMVLDKQNQPLRLTTVPDPVPGKGQVKLHILVCGVCRTDLHVLDGDLKEPK
jgi:propanol-preferring alcohol dehydrogenase